MWRRGGLMVSALDSGASGPGSSPGRGHCVVFLGKALNSHSASLHPGVKIGTGKLLGKSNKLWRVTCDGLANRPGEVGILRAASCYSNRDKLRQLCREPVLAPRLNFTMRICLLLRAT